MAESLDKDDTALLTEFYKDIEVATPCDDNETPLHLETRAKDTPITLTQSFFASVQYILGQLWLLVISILAALIPSFVPRWGYSTPNTISDRRLSQTAYLDGLRGVAAFIVYLVHFIVNWFPALRNTYGATPTDRYFFQLPIIRVFLSGAPAVTAFFVISGYALSYNALRKINKGEKSAAFDALSSSTFRRCLRIYLPCAADTFICMLLSYNGLFTRDPLGWNTIPPQLPTFATQFWDWWGHQQNLMYPLIAVEGQPYSPPYNGHLWTIPFEIRGSFVVYTTVLAAAKVNGFWRKAFLIAWVSYLWYEGTWDLFLFVSGVLLAEFDILRRSDATEGNTPGIDEGGLSLPTDNPHMSQMSMEQRVENDVWQTAARLWRENPANMWRFATPALRILIGLSPYGLFFIALYLMSYPHIPWGGAFLDSITPDHFLRLANAFEKKSQAWRCMGSVLLVTSLSLSPPVARNCRVGRSSFFQGIFNHISSFSLQALFTNSFVQYLGRISFGLYLMHGPVLFCLGTKFLGQAWIAYVTDPDLERYCRSFFIAAIFNTITVIWAADVFTRFVDEPSVEFASLTAKYMSNGNNPFGWGNS